MTVKVYIKVGALCFANYHPMNVEGALNIKKGAKLVLYVS